MAFALEPDDLIRASVYKCGIKIAEQISSGIVVGSQKKMPGNLLIKTHTLPLISNCSLTFWSISFECCPEILQV